MSAPAPHDNWPPYTHTTVPRAVGGARLHVAGNRVWCRWLKPEDYPAAEDLTDYNLASS